MKPVEIAKCPQVNPRVSNVEKVSYCKVVVNWDGITTDCHVFTFLPNNALLVY